MLKVICKSQRRVDVAELRCAKYASTIAEELSVGKTYIVYGQCIVDGCLLYLLDTVIRDGVSYPNWYPVSLFTVCDAGLPTSWKFMYYPQREFSGLVEAVWGYDALVTSPEHYSGLIERDLKALEMFGQYKAELGKTDDY